jgi:uncharacterized protein (TIGR02145 family)
VKNILKIAEFFLLILSINLFNSCKKDKTSLSQVTSITVSNISGTTAISGGNISSDGGAPIIARGVCWNTTNDPTIANSKTSDGAGNGTFSSIITGLAEGTTYHIRAYATNSVGTAYGEDLFFSTLAKPILSTAVPDSLTQTKAFFKVNIIYDGGSEIVAKGVCWGTLTEPIVTGNHTSDGTGKLSYNSEISGLSSNTIYHVRSYATNSDGTGYGTDTTLMLWLNEPGPQTTDIDGNIYSSVKIGNQVWMTSNLKTTRFNDGLSLPYDSTGWLSSLHSACYCWYNNTETDYKSIYGALYDWTSVNNGKLCPIGWHVPTINEWLLLMNYIEGYSSGGKLKRTGTDYWLSPNQGATNETGFNAMPGGYRISSGYFYNIGYEGNWWTATEDKETDYYNAYFIRLSSDAIFMFHSIVRKDNSFSVRCLKN